MTTDSVDIPPWLTVGAPVVELGRSRSSVTTVHDTTVERIGKARVTLANGTQYGLRTLRRDGYTWELVAAGDPRVARARADEAVSDAAYAADVAARYLRGDRTPERARQVADAYEALAVALEHRDNLHADH